MAPDQSLRAQHWREFMEEVLGISPDTPLADVLPSVIMKAAKPHYASILTEAAVKARSMATATQPAQLQAPQFPVGLGQGHTRGYQPYSRPHHQIKSPAVSPEFVRARLEQAIFSMQLPSQLIDRVRFTGHEGTTGSGNFRMDFTDWTFGEKGHPGPLPSTAINMLEALFRSVSELDAQGVQIMNYTIPFMVRVTFRSEYRGRLFERALQVKDPQPQESDSLYSRRAVSPIASDKTEHRHSGSSNSGAPVSDQYPPRTSYQAAATALIDSYRPSAPSQTDSGNQRLSSSSHKIDSPQIPERHPAEALREHGRSRSGRENGRLSPIRDIKMNSTVSTGVKRQRDDSPNAGEDTQLSLRPQGKRPRASDFVDMGDGHYP